MGSEMCIRDSIDSLKKSTIGISTLFKIGMCVLPVCVSGELFGHSFNVIDLVVEIGLEFRDN